MRNRIAVTLAVLFTVTLAATITAHADTNSATPSLAVESVCGQASHVFDIRNTGSVTAAGLTYTICAGASPMMPALKTWTLPLFPLSSGEVFHVNVPSSAWGLKVWVKVSAITGNTIASSRGVTSYPNFCW